MIVSFCDFRGSPPHTRGILRDERFDLLRNGFTPAYAGNTVGLKIGKALAEVHPRIRGEYTAMPVPWAPEPGSPPHTRGIRMRGVLFSCQFGFTPAYAGNTLGAFVVVRAVQVHPRIRGEYV